VNYISHYFIDGIDGMPYYNLGLILPDLAGIYDRHLKLLDPVTHRELTKTDQELYAGILKHHELDSVFHQSEYFIRFTSLLKKYFTQFNYTHQKNRQHFIAHVLLELIIDLVIIKREERILDRFYFEIDKVVKDDFIHFFLGLDIKYIIGFYDFVDRFRTKRYLLNFTSSDAVVFVLQKIQERVGLEVVTNENQIISLKKCIDTLSEDIEDEYNRLKTIRDDFIIENYAESV